MSSTKTRRRHRRFTVHARLAGALLVTCLATRAHAEDVWTDPFPGTRLLHRTTSNQNIHVLRVDLCAAGVSFRATKPSEKGKTASAFGSSVGAQATVNGDFYVSGFALERGIAVGDGIAWPIGTPEDESVGQLAFGDERVELIPDSVLQKVEPWMKEVVGGRPTVLLDGKGTDTSGHPNLCQLNPRTAVGLTKDKKVLFVAVVDGRATSRVGMTCNELGAFMKEIGAHDALAFDGGGSATMWIQGKGVVNYPTDGSERTVANHLAIFAKGQGKATACIPDPRGLLESATCTDGITGWVKNAPEGAFVELSFDETPGTPNGKVRSVGATSKRADTCNEAGVCGLGFSLPIPDELRDGESHPVWASFKGASADVFEGSPMTFTCGTKPGRDAGDPDGGPAGTDARPRTRERLSDTVASDGCQAAPVRAGGVFALVVGGMIAGLTLERARRRNRR